MKYLAVYEAADRVAMLSGHIAILKAVEDFALETNNPVPKALSQKLDQARDHLIYRFRQYSQLAETIPPEDRSMIEAEIWQTVAKNQSVHCLDPYTGALLLSYFQKQ
ncbi:MAG: hypothetical protein ACOCU8_01085 [Patescibacteria group bacterium]